MSRRSRTVLSYIGCYITYCVLCVGTAFADIANPGDPASAVSIFSNFSQAVNSQVMPALMALPSGQFAETLWIFFFVILIVSTVWRYMMNQIHISEIFELLFFVLMVRALMIAYNPITEALWGWAYAFGGDIQKAVVGTDDYFFCQTFIYQVIESISWSSLSIWAAINEILAIILLYMSTWVLIAITYIAAAWALWCFFIAKLTGWMFVPTLMFERLEFLFQGWLRFFFSTLLYMVFLRANIALECLALRMFFILPNYTGAVPAHAIQVTSVGDFIGIVVICLIGILGILSAGRMAQNVAAGMPSMGGSLRSFAMVVAKASGAG